MKQLDFNTLDEQVTNDNLNLLSEQALQAVQELQVPAPDPFLPSHVVSPIIQKQMGKEQLKEKEEA